MQKKTVLMVCLCIYLFPFLSEHLTSYEACSRVWNYVSSGSALSSSRLHLHAGTGEVIRHCESEGPVR